MKLLIVTQAIDRNDLSLGFFNRWAEVFAKNVESLDIICLKEGEHHLPQNVRVHSLGKPSSRFLYVFRFYIYVWQLRGSYDTVLVHMNEEYVLLGGFLWKLMGKRVGLWRNHVQGNWKATIGCRVADVVFYTSPDTYATRFRHAYRMPTGIDIEAFSAANTGKEGSILSLGRIDPVKKVAELLAAVELLQKERTFFHADVYGTPTPGREAYAESLAPQFQKLEAAGVLTRRPGVPHAQTAGLFGSHRIFINLTPPGSFDKAIFEAMAAGCLVVAANPGLRETIGDLFVESLQPGVIARALRAALARPDALRTAEAQKLKEYVAREHSLAALVEKILAHLHATS